MFSVLVVYGGEGDAQRYRCQHLCEQLQLFGIRCDLVEFRNQPLLSSENYQFAIFHRVPLDRWLANYVRKLKQANTVVLFDTDDLVFDTSQLAWVRSLVGSDKLRIALYHDEVQRYCAMLEAAHLGFVSTQFLQSQIKERGLSASIHRNAFSLKMLKASSDALAKLPDSASEKVIIGYASGTPTHDQDFKVIKSVLKNVLSKFSHVELQIIGHLNIGSDWGNERERIRQIPFVPWQKLPYLLAQFDINLAPLESGNPFCEAKSELKYLEAAMVRVPTIASRTTAFEYAINSGNGFLASSPEEWENTLNELITNPNIRIEAGYKAYADVLNRYHPLYRGKDLLQTLNQAYLDVNGKSLIEPHYLRVPTEYDLSEYCEMLDTPQNNFVPTPPPMWRRAQYSLQNKGLKILCLQFALYLRRRFLRQV